MSRSAILSFMLALAASASAWGAEPPVDARVDAEIQRLGGELDPVSADVLRGNQKTWDGWARSVEGRAAAMVKDGQAAPADLAEVKASLRQQRLNFLAQIKPVSSEGVKGGWGDGMREILLDMDGHGYAKLASIGQGPDGKTALCVVEGAVKEGADGFIITSNNLPDRRVHVRRLGIALQIEEKGAQSGDTASYCQSGGRLAGQYFRIEGAEKVMPWLLY
jgi:hypothetical protein